MTPDSGRCEVMGLTPWRDRIEHVRRIGVVFGQRSQLWWDLPVLESLELLRDIYAVDSRQYRANLDELVATTDIAALLTTPVRQLSLGQRMRCELAAALLHSPRILFLDEPTIGLDATSKLRARDLIRTLNSQRGVTVVLTTHDMDDVEALCRRVLLIGDGRILSDGSLAELTARVTMERLLIVDLADENQPFTDPDVEIVRREPNRLVLRFDPTAVPPHELIARVARSCAVRDLFVESPPIEEIIARLYQESAS
jgi:ABC-2 type transport system ATP-binding protein